MDMEQLYSYVPRELVTFVLVTLFSLLIGLSQRRISLKREGETTLFGTDRTFTFIGILGYLLYILDLYHRAHQILESLVGDVEGEERWDRQLYRMSQV